MGKPAAKDLTTLLVSYAHGDKQALEELLPQVYAHLHRLAQKYMARENPGHTLQPTALVHEAFLRLTQGKGADWQNRSHFYAVAARVMRRIVVDHAKAKKAEKRGGGGIRISFDERLHWEDKDSPDLVLLDEALEKLKTTDERLSCVVELRYFGGLNIDETAEVLKVSPATIKRDWSAAKLWLYRELTKGEESSV